MSLYTPEVDVQATAQALNLHSPCSQAGWGLVIAYWCRFNTATGMPFTWHADTQE
jgi:hypothetical protein